MLSDPLVVGAGFPAAGNLPRVSSEPRKSLYSAVIGSKTYDVTISHQSTSSRERCLMRLDVTDVAPNPLIPANSRARSISTYLVLDFEPAMSSQADALDAVKELIGVLGIATHANVVTTTLAKIIGGES